MTENIHPFSDVLDCLVYNNPPLANLSILFTSSTRKIWCVCISGWHQHVMWLTMHVQQIVAGGPYKTFLSFVPHGKLECLGSTEDTENQEHLDPKVFPKMYEMSTFFQDTPTWCFFLKAKLQQRRSVGVNIVVIGINKVTLSSLPPHELSSDEVQEWFFFLATHPFVHLLD